MKKNDGKYLSQGGNNASCCSVRLENGEAFIENILSRSQNPGGSHKTDQWTNPVTSSAEWASIYENIFGSDLPNNNIDFEHTSLLKPHVIGGAYSENVPEKPETRFMRRSRTTEETKAVAYHEAGHAVAAWRLPFGPTVTEATVVPAGISKGHVRWQERPALPGHEDLFDLTCAELGGMAAESLFLGKVTPLTNISDLQDANHAATKAIAEDYFEMHDMIRPELQPAARRTLTQTLICEAYCKTRELLRNHESDVHKVALALISEGTLRWRDLHKILGPQGLQEVELAWEKLCDGELKNVRPSGSELPGTNSESISAEPTGSIATSRSDANNGNNSWTKNIGITICASLVGSLCLLACSSKEGGNSEMLSRWDALKITAFCVATHFFFSYVGRK